MKGPSLTALAALVITGVTPASAQNLSSHGHASVVASNEKASRAEFASAMRKLWEDHVVWTRQFIVSAVADLPDRDVAAERLLRNQDDIGNAIKPFYGDAAGARLTTLLREHITIAAELVGAAKLGKQEAVQTQSAAWYANADSISAFLASANSNWNGAELRATMREHLDLTLKEAVARLQKDWKADVAAYDMIHDHILRMADVLSTGIMRQFPNGFTR